MRIYTTIFVAVPETILQCYFLPRRNCIHNILPHMYIYTYVGTCTFVIYLQRNTEHKYTQTLQVCYIQNTFNASYNHYQYHLATPFESQMCRIVYMKYIPMYIYACV